MVVFLGHVEFIRGRKIGLHEAGFEITMTNSPWPEVVTCKEMHLMSDNMFVPFAVSQDIRATLSYSHVPVSRFVNTL